MRDPAARLHEGAVFAGDYRVVRPLAEGGMGAVYVVEQLSTGKARALKLMRPELAQDAGSRQRFELEARVGAHIESDHVVEIHSAGVEGDTPYIVMELLDGEDLAARVARAGPLSPGEARDVLEQVCHAVAAAHRAGIVHRDLKPENMFLAKTKSVEARVNVKLLDFGIAKLVAESTTRGQNQTMGMIGTPKWMAPEQTELGRISPAADVWALGLILFWSLTGRSYWRAADNPEATLTQLLTEVVMGPLPPASARARELGVPGRFAPELDAVFARAVVRDPRRRFADAEQLWSALSAVLGPPSVRVLAGASALSALDETAPGSGASARASTNRSWSSGGGTVAAAPPGGGTEAAPKAFIPSFIPKIEPAPFDHEPGIRSGRGPLARFWPVPVILALAIATQQGVSCASRRDRAPAGPGPTVALPPNFTATPVNRGRRFSVTSVSADGPVQQGAIVAVVEIAGAYFYQQCMRARAERELATTFAFVIVRGTAKERAVQRASADPAADACIAFLLVDLRFPDHPEETRVSLTLSYDPSRSL